MPAELPLILVFSVKKVSQAAVLENHQVFGFKRVTSFFKKMLLAHKQ